MRALAAILATLAAAPAASADIVGTPRISDGDTVSIAGARIRLGGIDAPESEQLCLDPRGQRWTCGSAARNALARQFGRALWRCIATDVDRYGRTVASCSAAGQDVGGWMVRQGWALAFVRYSAAYQGEETAARQRRAGLWAGAFIAPWEWRARSADAAVRGAASVPPGSRPILTGASPDADAPSQGCAIKGNTRRDGTCIFHRPGGRWYGAVRMGGPGKRWFCTAAEAEAAGCRAAVE